MVAGAVVVSADKMGVEPMECKYATVVMMTVVATVFVVAVVAADNRRCLDYILFVGWNSVGRKYWVAES